jgi:hypothetical protein
MEKILSAREGYLRANWGHLRIDFGFLYRALPKQQKKRADGVGAFKE